MIAPMVIGALVLVYIFTFYKDYSEDSMKIVWSGVGIIVFLLFTFMAFIR